MAKDENTNVDIVTSESLSEVKYQDLKAKFEELGIPDVWKGGKKKEDLIEQALGALAKIRTGVEFEETNDGDETPETSTEDLQKKEETKDGAEQETTDENPKPDDETPEIKLQPLHQATKCPYGYDKMEIPLLIKLKRKINSNLGNGIPAQAQILKLKLVAIEKVMVAKGYVEEKED